MSSYTKRYIANITIEAASALKIGGSDVDMLQDSPVQKDWNNLPMILGTSIAGVLRTKFDDKTADEIFGDEDSQKKDAKGSRIIISNALLCDEAGKVHEGLKLPEQDFLQKFSTLPIRDHVRIDDKGVSDIENRGKFDEEVVYKGSRFKFRIEFIADDKDEDNWNSILKIINANTFRLGGGTTKGFGDVKVISEKSTYSLFDFDSVKYRVKTSSLETTFDTPFPSEKEENTHVVYKLDIVPEDFFIFGSGFGDDDADQMAVKEKIITWDNNKGNFQEEHILIPASSIKGALSHRTAYYYNKDKKEPIFADKIKKEDFKNHIGENNEAVRAIFGFAKDKDLGEKGKILISDCYKKDENNTKVFDHVKIDRFTGGAVDQALFNEKTVAKIDDRDIYKIEILLKKGIDDEYIKAFENALRDVSTGMLPLGGMTTKGHGVFMAEELLKDGEDIKNPNKGEVS